MRLADRLEQLLVTPFTPAEDPWPALTVAPDSRRDRFLTLLRIYDLHAAGPEAGDEVRWASHPAVAAVKLRLEHEWIAELDGASGSTKDLTEADARSIDPVRVMRALAASDRLPTVYQHIARHATYTELREFIAVEGGPDGGFDDLVAVAQVGLRGSAKQELAQNYWDEMGDGDPTEVHTDLYERMVALLDVPMRARADLPVEALERSALGGLLATNHWLQPEMIGALGLIELQAGPRCRLVLQAFERLGLPEAAQRFYAVHADVDPIHGKDWLEKAVGPLAADRPDWRPRIVRGARWRWAVNKALFDLLDVHSDPVAA